VELELMELDEQGAMTGESVAYFAGHGSSGSISLDAIQKVP